jgi:hypothetical protein
VIYGLRDFSPTHQVYWASTYDTKTEGVLGVRVGGVDYTGDTLNASNGYNGNVTGVAGEYQMLLDGEPVSGATGTTPAFPADGDEFDILFIADSEPISSRNAFDLIRAREPNAKLVVAEEMYYLDSGLGGGAMYGAANAWPGGGDQSSENPSALAALLEGDETNVGFRGKYVAQFQTHPDRQAFWAKYPMIDLADNHQFGASLGSGWYTPALATGPGGVAYDAAWTAYQEWCQKGWPKATGDVDSEPAPLGYFSKKIGPLLIIALDQRAYDFIGGRNLHSASWGEIKQPGWVIDQIQNTDADYIMLISVSPIDANMGSWVNATNTITDAINESAKTIFCMTGDMHAPWARMIYEDVPDRPMFEIGCSPCSPTKGTAVFAPFAGDQFLFTKIHHGTVLAQELAPTDTAVVVEDTAMMSDPLNDNLQRLYTGTAPLKAMLIDSINHETKTVALTGAVGGTTTYPVGTLIWFHTVHDENHVDAAPPHLNIYYTKITVNAERIRFRMYEVFTDYPILDVYIRNGERLPHPSQRGAFPVSGL